MAPDVHPRLYVASIGQCALTYAQLTSGALEVAESVKHGLDSSGFSPSNSNTVFSPYCCPSQHLIETGKIPNRLLQGDGSDPTLGYRLTEALATFVKRYKQKLTTENEQLLSENNISSNPNSYNTEDHLCDVFPTIPMIINTHGWISGLGWQLIEAIGGLGWVTYSIELIKSKDWRRIGIYEKQEEKKDLHESNKEKEMDDMRNSKGTTKSWGPKTMSLDIENPFIDLVEQFCGRLPLGLDRLSKNGIRLICSAFDSDAIHESQRVKSEHLRWLRFMSLFNCGYRHAVHFPVATPEGQEEWNFTSLKTFIKIFLF